MSNRTELKTAYKKALDLLARRDHAASEIYRKLLARGFDSTIIDSVQAQLAADNLLDDRRFAESFLRMRSEKGFGERYIRAKLVAKGVSASDIEWAFAGVEIDWMSLARQVMHAKLGNQHVHKALSSSGAKRAARFLESRGFTTQQIYRLINELTKEQGEVY